MKIILSDHTGWLEESEAPTEINKNVKKTSLLMDAFTTGNYFEAKTLCYLFPFNNKKGYEWYIVKDKYWRTKNSTIYATVILEGIRMNAGFELQLKVLNNE